LSRKDEEDAMSTTVPQTYKGSYLMPSLKHATVADAMHPGILSCDADATLTEVAQMMATHHVHCVVVMGIAPDAGAARLAWGVISDLSLVRGGIRKGADELAGALAEQPIITAEPDTPLREAGELMLARGVSHVVVVEPRLRRPVGILSTLDIAAALAWAGT
jgi:CBS domain-containing protein